MLDLDILFCQMRHSALCDAWRLLIQYLMCYSTFIIPAAFSHRLTGIFASVHMWRIRNIVPEFLVIDEKSICALSISKHRL